MGWMLYREAPLSGTSDEHNLPSACHLNTGYFDLGCGDKLCRSLVSNAETVEH